MGAAGEGREASAQRVVDVRRVLGLTREELAAYLDVPTWVVHGWEGRRRPVPDGVLVDLAVLEQVGPEIRELLPLRELRTDRRATG